MTGRPPRSLNRRLLASVLLVSVAYWVAIALLTMRDNAGEIDELFDRQLAQTALALLRVADPDEVEPSALGDAAGSASAADALSTWAELPQRLDALRAARHAAASSADEGAGDAGADRAASSARRGPPPDGRPLRYQVWTSGGELLLRSPNAPAHALAQADGFTESTEADGRIWRVYALRDQHGDFRVVVAEDRALRERMYRAYATRASEFGQAEWNNGPLIERILELRAEEARLLGFANYAELSLTPKMADSPAQVAAFLRASAPPAPDAPAALRAAEAGA